MSVALPFLSTPRLVLKALHKDQAEVLCTLASGPLIAENTATIPSPYTLEVAHAFIGELEEKYRSGTALGLGIHLRETGELVGMVSIRLSANHHSGLLGGWVAADCRDRGYAAEAACGLMHFGFSELALHRIGGQCFTRNRASARVMEKIGLRYEGCQPGAFLKNGVYEDLSLFGVVRKDWQNPLDSREYPL
ncbi:GNAT family N-acetyltransferase [Pseudomonas sp. PAMC 25886]|jgi:RimJ/RimL family protein N-acetyltransferase|uniref:GNAT family N-acetyltransferase n=1 Tax=Pseudomonas sp. PAMC 25886 TaxID=1125977 RepID=UPI000287BD88|nr:GNAT family protein [Pseudomonas sp. PAMC 25886]